MNMTDFEFSIDTWCYVPNADGSMHPVCYTNIPRKRYITILDTFIHHFTGERMCRIREEWVDGEYPMAEEKIVKESAVVKLFSEHNDIHESEMIFP